MASPTNCSSSKTPAARIDALFEFSSMSIDDEILVGFRKGKEMRPIVKVLR
jgi:hypothetical protein